MKWISVEDLSAVSAMYHDEWQMIFDDYINECDHTYCDHLIVCFEIVFDQWQWILLFSMIHDSPKRIDNEFDVDVCSDDWLIYWMIECDEWMLNSSKLIEICWWNDDILMLWFYLYNNSLFNIFSFIIKLLSL